jgi:hypothetical protein
MEREDVREEVRGEGAKAGLLDMGEPVKELREVVPARAVWRGCT